jgi:hypothetical protein
MAAQQVVSQVISEVEEQHAGSQRMSQVISEVEEQHAGSQRMSQVISEVEWQRPPPDITGTITDEIVTEDDMVAGNKTIVITLLDDTWISA